MDVRIEELIESYNKIINQNNKRIIRNISTNTIRNFSRNIVTNYKNINKYFFNLIVSSAIDKIKLILDQETIKIEGNNNKFLLFKYPFKHIHKNKSDKYFDKVLYLFYYTGIQRNIINYLQKNSTNYNKYNNISLNSIISNNPSLKNNPSLLNYFLNHLLNEKIDILMKNFPNKYGILSEYFYKGEIQHIKHPLIMRRFNGYKERILQNILSVKENNLFHINGKDICIENKIYFDVNELIPSYTERNESIYIYNILECIKVSNEDTLNIIDNESFLGNNSGDIESNIIFLNILSYCLEVLQEQKCNPTDIPKYLLVFYYLTIFLMPFYLGTAAIAEILLYSLWEKYTNSSIEINSNIMLDIEALTLPFNLFYDNCFNRTTFNNYTQYLLIHLQNNTRVKGNTEIINKMNQNNTKNKKIPITNNYEIKLRSISDTKMNQNTEIEKLHNTKNKKTLINHCKINQNNTGNRQTLINYCKINKNNTENRQILINYSKINKSKSKRSIKVKENPKIIDVMNQNNTVNRQTLINNSKINKSKSKKSIKVKENPKIIDAMNQNNTENRQTLINNSKINKSKSKKSIKVKEKPKIIDAMNQNNTENRQILINHSKINKSKSKKSIKVKEIRISNTNMKQNTGMEIINTRNNIKKRPKESYNENTKSENIKIKKKSKNSH